MPKTIDLEARNQSVIDAAWRVISRDGITRLTVRAVAAEAGLPPSSLRYTFPTQAILRERAIQNVLDRLEDRIRDLGRPERGRSWSRAALYELLPLDPTRETEMRVYIALGNAASTDEALRPIRDKVQAKTADVCRRALGALGEESDTEVQLLHALVDGLALHILYGQGSGDPLFASDVIDRYIDRLQVSR